MAVLNPSAAAVATDLHFPPSSSAPSASLLAGAVGGSLLGGGAADALGPARALVGVGATFALGSLWCAASTSLTALAAGRVVAGVAVGAASALPPRLIADVAPPTLRGPAGAAHQVVICFGIVVAMLAGLAYDDGGSDRQVSQTALPPPWRLALAACALPGLTLTLLATICTESPVWLAVVGRDADAAAAAAALGAKPRAPRSDGGEAGGEAAAADATAPPPLTRQGSGALVRQGSGVVVTPRAGGLVRHGSGSAFPLSPRAGDAHPLSPLSPRAPSPMAEAAPLVPPWGSPSPPPRDGGAVAQPPLPPPSWRAVLTRPSLRRPLTLALGLAIAQQASGINVVILYSTSVLASAGVTRAVAAGAAVATVNLAASAASAAASDALGRRRALVSSYAAMAACLAALAAALASPRAGGGGAVAALASPRAGGGGAVAALIAYVSSFALGAGPVTWLYLGEILPPAAAGRVGGAAAAANWMAAALVAATWPHIAATVGVAGGYVGYAAANALAAAWAAARVVESAGRPLEAVRATIAGGGGGGAGL